MNKSILVLSGLSLMAMAAGSAGFGHQAAAATSMATSVVASTATPRESGTRSPAPNLNLRSPAVTPVVCQRIVVPAYFYPGPSWTQSSASKPVPRVMILDISGSGAGTAPDPNYRAAVKKAQAAGTFIMGYADTNYGLRPVAQVEADVRNYKAWYNVKGIFLDEAASSSLGVPYYRLLTNYIHQVNPGAGIMLNPGVYPSEKYMALGDTMMVFESPYTSYVNLKVPSWARKYPASRFVHTVYNTPASKMASVIALSRTRNAEYIYVTGNTGANPYSSLPSYWASENAAVAAEC